MLSSCFFSPPNSICLVIPIWMIHSLWLLVSTQGFLLHLLSLFPLLPLSRSYPFSLSPCPSLCTCYPSPPTASCQSHNLSRVPSPLPNQARRVFLQNNQISELSPGLFSPLTSVLWLFSNRISVLRPGTFQGLEHLEELDLGKNPNLPPLQPDTFSGLNSLLSLHLYQCNIHRLPADLFRGLHSLRYLYLQHNRLTGLPVSKTFKYLEWPLKYVYFNWPEKISPKKLDSSLTEDGCNPLLQYWTMSCLH